MSSISIGPLFYATMKEVRYRLEEKETFDDEKSDGKTIEMLFNTFLSFQTMSTRMAFTASLMFSYFDKCLTDNG
jgi:hypothetical protein